MNKRRTNDIVRITNILEDLFNEIKLVNEVMDDLGVVRTNENHLYRDYLNLRATFRYYKRKMDNSLNLWAGIDSKVYKEILEVVDFEKWYEPDFNI